MCVPQRRLRFVTVFVLWTPGTREASLVLYSNGRMLRDEEKSFLRISLSDAGGRSDVIIKGYLSVRPEFANCSRTRKK